MNWKTLMQDIPYQVIGEGNSEEITSIEYDSRKVRQGSAFVAVAGGAFDGHDFIAQAAEAGAVLAVVEKEIRRFRKECASSRWKAHWQQCRAWRFGFMDGHPSPCI